MSQLDFPQDGGTVRNLEILSHCIVDFEDILGENDIEVNDELAFLGVVSPEGVDDLFEGVHHLDQVDQLKHKDILLIDTPLHLCEAHCASLLQKQSVVIEILLRNGLIEDIFCGKGELLEDIAAQLQIHRLLVDQCLQQEEVLECLNGS
jgi:hypothetical protein